MLSLKSTSGYSPISTNVSSPSSPSRRSTLFLTSALALSLLLYTLRPSTPLPFPSKPLHSSGSSEREHDAGPVWSPTTLAGQEGRKPRIAIIGSGAAGSSASYFLGAHFQGLGVGLDSEIVVFEKESRVGGRAAVAYVWQEEVEVAEDAGEEPVELGASIFAAANLNMHKAVRVFNLTLVEHDSEGGGMAIWDGTSFVFEQVSGSYWDLFKMFWRYGRSPLWVKRLVDDTTKSFLSLYEPPFASLLPISSLPVYASLTNLSYPASLSASSFFGANGITPLFTQEVVAAATTVNYGSSVSTIHGLGALVSMAASGAAAVKGGNKVVFERFLKGSGASVKRGEAGRVTELVRLDKEDGERTQWVVRTADGGGGTFDAVIMAAPFAQTDIQVLNSPFPFHLPSQPYVHLHVTFVITNATHPLPSYFNLPPTSKVPISIFSTFDSPESYLNPARFNSLNYMKVLQPSTSARFGEGDWHVVKLFSSSPLSTSFLQTVFGETEVGKVWSKEWDAYPVLEPIVDDKELAKVRLDQGLYYVNGFERLISTMETETMASWNVVTLLLKDFWGYEPGKSWAGWDDE